MGEWLNMLKKILLIMMVGVLWVATPVYAHEDVAPSQTERITASPSSVDKKEVVEEKNKVVAVPKSEQPAKSAVEIEKKAPATEKQVKKKYRKPSKAEIETHNEIIRKFIVGYYHGISRICEIMNIGEIDDKVEPLDRNMIAYDNHIYVDKRVPADKTVNPKKTSVLATLKSGNVLKEVDNIGTMPDGLSLRKFIETKINETDEEQNGFFLVELTGKFSDIRLAEVLSEDVVNKSIHGEKTKKTAEYKYDQLEGKIIAIRVTDYLKTKESLGWNLHFASTDKTKSGTVINLKVDEAKMILKKIRSLSIYM